ncbi:MAG: DUF4192 domain-containing protein [Saccharopolyspora sp.]|uniref:DUF4192 domain-containing protein n=1 Tax=Saccharopolyspora sp. TaxID=33915 RepID=UPI0025DCD0EA|nr:DUF4192 domain-containing protein [Saccharopolyspora sp.]MBQ6644083.1 DUF4192 domain-containing protein [Saccharopolyspora sp.]
MTTSTHSVRLGDPADVLAAVPHLLGFTPSQSLVLVALHETSDTSAACGVTLRIDLPESENHSALAEYLVKGPLARQDATAVLLVIVGTDDREPDDPDGQPGAAPPTDHAAGEAGSLPYSGLAGVLAGAFREAGFSIWHLLWTPRLRAGGSWQCYDDPTCGGKIPDPKSSAMGAALAASGAVTFESRSELERLVAPESEELSARWSAKLNELIEESAREPAGARKDVELVLGAVARTAANEALTELDQLRVQLALSDSRVRDLCLSAALGDNAMAAEQLWLTLVRKAPAPEVAEVAAMLAFSAYLRGEGALAGVALERIESCRPEHPLGCLLRGALDAGVPPKHLESLTRDAIQDAKLTIDEDELS